MPHELEALRRHHEDSRRGMGFWLRATADTAHSFLTARFISTLVIAALALTAFFVLVDWLS